MRPVNVRQQGFSIHVVDRYAERRACLAELAVIDLDLGRRVGVAPHHSGYEPQMDLRRDQEGAGYRREQAVMLGDGGEVNLRHVADAADAVLHPADALDVIRVEGRQI